MYAKIENDKVIQCPYNRGYLKRDNPQTSFREPISEEIMLEYGVVKVIETERPVFNPVTHTVRMSVKKIKKKWTQVWEVEELPVDIAGPQIKEKRNILLAETDWRFRSDQSPTQEWIDYCQALRDITDSKDYPYNITWPTEPEE